MKKSLQVDKEVWVELQKIKLNHGYSSMNAVISVLIKFSGGANGKNRRKS